MTETGLLGGRYELGEVLGYGGMAEVWRATDVRLGREVAIKMLRPDLARDPSFQNRFRREAQAAAGLNHPAIVSVYDTGDEQSGTTDAPYIVMEYVEGRTLREVLRAEGRLLPERALEITADVLSALEYSHERGIVHRDIKPGNVMLTPAGDIKVMDFGIARAVTGAAATMTQTAAVVGTAHYLSPEQARGERVDGRSDIYSAGCLLYELLTGTPPFTGDTPVAVAYQHVREDPVPPSRIDSDIPPSIDAIVMKSLAKNPANRYQTAREMREDIARALAGRPVEATPLMADETLFAAASPATTVLLRRPEPRRSRRGLAYTLLTLGVLAIFVAAALVTRSLISNTSSSVNMPSVVNLQLSQAEQILGHDGLHNIHVIRQWSGQKAGTVINQSPNAPQQVSKNTPIQLTVSRGIRYVNVPFNLINVPQNVAIQSLRAAGLRPGTITLVNSSQQAGLVLRTDPAPGSRLPAGSKVKLFVANGKVQVPYVIGKAEPTAVDLLEAAGFIPNIVKASDPTQAAGIVLTETPGGYQPRGATITITVNSPPSPSPTGSPSPSPSGSGSPSNSPSNSPSP
jgi:serine/threonine protein kinase